MDLTDAHDATLSRYGEQIQSGRAVLLVGSGVSAPPPSNLPTWCGFVEAMANFARDYSEPLAATMLEFLAEGKYLAAADLFTAGDKIPKQARARFFLSLFDTKGQQVPEICREVAALDVGVILTTNFDNNLRFALEGREADVLSNSAEELKTAFQYLDERQMLIHLHGKALVYDSIVYTTERYRQVGENKTYEELLRQVFSRHSVLAVGFSFADPPFQNALQFVAEHLGGSPRAAHVAVLPSASTIDKALLARAGFECVLYDERTGHEYVGACVRRLRRFRRVRADNAPRALAHSGGEQDLSALVSAFLSVTNPDRGSTFDTAAAAIVIDQLTKGPLNESDLVAEVSTRTAMAPKVIRGLVRRGLEYLIELGRVAREGEVLHAVSDDSARKPQEVVVDAVLVRMRAIDRTVESTQSTERAVRVAVTHLMMAQGMAAARAFLDIDSPEVYALHRAVADAVRQAPIGARWRRPLELALTEVLQEPTPGASRELFRLANAAFALESVFLNPHGVDLGQALRWRVYLDSNVVLRILDQSRESGTGFAEFHDRLRRLRAPMYSLGPFLEEILGNVRVVGQQLDSAAASTPALVAEMCATIPPHQRSPVLSWYAWGLTKFKWKSYPEFVARQGLGDAASLTRELRKLDIMVEGQDSVRQYDTSARETLWSDLREWRTHEADSEKGRRLRRAEATQVLYLSDLRANGERAWFISIDGQLRRALKYACDGRYAGYVMTPGAWLLRLNMLHWGEVDVSGFSELMWAVPRAGHMDRIKAMVMTRVLQAEPDLRGEEPDWLRDKVDDEFTRLAAVITANAEAADDEKEEEEIVADIAAQVVGPTAHRILDDLAKRRRA